MLLWVVASVGIAAWIAPWIYVVGKGIGEAALAGGWDGVGGWLGSACRRAGFGRYFNRSLMLAALGLLPVLWWRLRGLRRVTMELPGWRLDRSLRSGWWLWLLGAVVSAGVVWCLGLGLEAVGSFALRPEQPGMGVWLQKAVWSAVAVAVVEEWLFRGLFLGLWLRVSRPWAACVGTSLVFAFVHFLAPPPGYQVADPTSVWAGFRWLGGILLHFTDPGFIAADFLTLFGIGVVLAGARLRTGGLWLPVGLHFGWVFAFKGFNLNHAKLADGPVGALLVGESLRSGLLPLAALGVTAGICHIVLRLADFRPAEAPR